VIKEILKYLGNAEQMSTYCRTACIRKNAQICRWVEELVGKIRVASDRELLAELAKHYDALHIASYYRGLLADCAGQPSSSKRRYEMR